MFNDSSSIFTRHGISFILNDFVSKPKRDTKSVGDRSEVQVLCALVEAGYNVSIPFGENHRYDLIAEDTDGRLLKIQVETGRLRNGAIEFNGCSTHSHRGGSSTRSYRGEIDFFAVCCADNAGIYLVPEAEVGLRPHLRIKAPMNNQQKTVRWASDYYFAEATAPRLWDLATPDDP
jgi:hypothetical protein